MGLMDLLGDATKQREYEDFTRRYDEGEPHEGIDGGEALGRYQEVTQHLSPEEYEEVSRDAFARMSPEGRRELGRHLSAGAASQGIDADGDESRYEDPGALAGLAGRVQREQPGMMGQLLSGLGGGGAMGAVGGLLGGGGGGGGGGLGGMLSNPVAKSALAGIAAMAAKRVMRR